MAKTFIVFAEGCILKMMVMIQSILWQCARIVWTGFTVVVSTYQEKCFRMRNFMRSGDVKSAHK